MLQNATYAMVRDGKVTHEEMKMKRALAVENMYRLYKKYYPAWKAEQQATQAETVK